jgi:hypothetical protein
MFGTGLIGFNHSAIHYRIEFNVERTGLYQSCLCWQACHVCYGFDRVKS